MTRALRHPATRLGVPSTKHRQRRGARRTACATLGAVGLALVVGAGMASAHIAPDPIAVQAGTPATVSFLVEHGCAGSDTTALDIKIPDSITEAKPVAKAGWTAIIEAGVVHFSGGTLDAKTPDTFTIAFTAPSAAGVVDFPIVQKCVVGETDWIDIAAAGQPEPEHPAAAMTITAGAPTPAELAPPHDEDATQGSTPAVDTAAPAVTVTTLTTGVTATTPTATKSDDSSNTGVVVGIIIAVVVIAAAGGAVYTLRKKRGGTQA
jgi:uncharacterized protein YcnI